MYPDPDDIEVIDLAYTKLPATAMLSRYLVLSTIYFWTPVKPTLESGKLKKLHPGFTLDVMTAQAQRGQPPEEGETDATKTVPQLAKHGLKNSCVFHEHQVFDEDTCRHRLANSKFIFDGILDACMKEAKTVVGKASCLPYFGGAFEGDFKEATSRKIELTDVTEQTFRTFLQWAHAQLYSSGFEEPIPDQSILGSNTTEESETAANDQNEYSDDEEEDASDHGSDHDSDHTSCESLVEMREKYELRKKNYDMAHVFVVLIESCSIDGMAMAI
ncbi:hypothetical protein SNOG_09285 [Parastagonospora nodorum SN15]|uniref:BTB domain-containing protein n=1 Tax=Phaeosphaeria nodorum (strain SN15 / ATCC MYA-4574 / FGSC 10173) TaxID=321614 RepID=Q0UG29_PHANO|nr:hypothetical protein SNOG_09285 [Parastagonospora nodorum SN15]EAT83477.2 hypothetical protein SNOG_09285 [Parastagonospora nodorum SN15]